MQCVIHSNRDEDDQNIRTLQWLLTEHQSKDVTDIIEKIKFPAGFSSNIKNILTKKG